MNTQATGEIRPNTTPHTEAVNDFFQQILNSQAERETATAQEIHHYLNNGGELFERWAIGGAA